jgi:NAD(P)-dependent dehydrogenase (short-subunit alcohol dehydrogenase family)
MRAAALDIAKDNVRINAVSPTLIDTAMPRANLTDEQMRAREQINPMKRHGQPADVVEAVVFLLDKDNSFMTGADIRVNGGGALF